MNLSNKNFAPGLGQRVRKFTFIGWSILFLTNIACLAYPMDRNCKIYLTSKNNGVFSDYEKIAISSFKSFNGKKVTKFEICTIEDGKDEIFFAIEKNVDSPPIPGSDLFIVINKKTLAVKVMEGK